MSNRQKERKNSKRRVPLQEEGCARKIQFREEEKVREYRKDQKGKLSPLSDSLIERERRRKKKEERESAKLGERGRQKGSKAGLQYKNKVSKKKEDKRSSQCLLKNRGRGRGGRVPAKIQDRKSFKERWCSSIS